jgi:hypothetical protein
MQKPSFAFYGAKIEASTLIIYAAAIRVWKNATSWKGAVPGSGS